MKKVRLVVPASESTVVQRGRRATPSDPANPAFYRMTGLVHDYSVPELRPMDIRPIHAWTCLGASLVRKYAAVRDWGTYVSMMNGLEQKLSAVRHHADQIKNAQQLIRTKVVVEGVEDYWQEHSLIAAVEALLAAIYSSLELVAGIIHERDRHWPRTFSKLAAKYPAMRFDRWRWLEHFWDIRTELTHYNAPFVQDEHVIQVHFSQSNTLRYYKAGRQFVFVDDVVDFGDRLLCMLDEWAVIELKNVDVTWQHGVYVGKDETCMRREFEPVVKLLEPALGRKAQPPQLVGAALRKFVQTNALVHSTDHLLSQAMGQGVVENDDPFDAPARALRQVGIADLEMLEARLQEYCPIVAKFCELFAPAFRWHSPIWTGMSVFCLGCAVVARVGVRKNVVEFAVNFGVEHLDAVEIPPGSIDLYGAWILFWTKRREVSCIE